MGKEDKVVVGMAGLAMTAIAVYIVLWLGFMGLCGWGVFELIMYLRGLS
jgi:hypothetical protein